MLNDLYFKTTCNIRPHFLGPMGGLKIEGPLYPGKHNYSRVTVQGGLHRVWGVGSMKLVLNESITKIIMRRRRRKRRD